MRDKLRDRVLIVLFCGTLFAITLMYLILPQKDFSANEKRVLKQFPKIELESILNGRFEDDAETAFSDQVPFRDAFVGVYAYTRLALGQNGLNGVIRGKDGALYASAEKYNEEALRGKFERIERFVQDSGLPIDVMFIPTSGYMHPEALPELHDPYHDAQLYQLAQETLSDSTRFLWPEDALKGDGIYYRTDHHLTSRGSYTACAEYLRSIERELPPVDAYDVEATPGFHGSMYSKSGLWLTKGEPIEVWRLRGAGKVTTELEGKETFEDMFFPAHLETNDKYPVFLDGNHGIVKITTGNTGGGTLLMIRDSFGHCFAPFAAGSFEKIILIDLRYYRAPLKELIETENVDRVLFLYGVDSFLTDTNFGWLKYE